MQRLSSQINGSILGVGGFGVTDPGQKLQAEAPTTVCKGHAESELRVGWINKERAIFFVVWVNPLGTENSWN